MYDRIMIKMFEKALSCNGLTLYYKLNNSLVFTIRVNGNAGIKARILSDRVQDLCEEMENNG